MTEPMNPERRAEIEQWVIELGTYTGGVLPAPVVAALSDLLAEVDRLEAERDLHKEAAEEVAKAFARRRDEAERLGAELATARPVLQAAREWYDAGGGGAIPDGRLHRATRVLRRAVVAALSGTALADALGADVVREYPSHDAAVAAEMARRADPVPLPAEPRPLWAVGDRVRRAAFGDGTVREVRPSRGTHRNYVAWDAWADREPFGLWLRDDELLTGAAAPVPPSPEPEAER